MSVDARPDIEVRPYSEGDHAAMLDLLGASLGWLPDGEHTDFFRWKHVDNHFGASPVWVAVSGERLVGLRAFMRWEFLHDGGVVRVVRAVDTATHPDFQGQGIFSRLTLHGLDWLRDDGVAFVFNTPNDRSRPGYLKMGWQVVGRLPAMARLGSIAGLWRLATARTPAELWSMPSRAGLAAAEVLADGDAVARLLASVPSEDAVLRTGRSVAYLRWRYATFEPLRYRAMLAGASVEDGLLLFRVRRRGRAREAAVAEVLVPGGDRRVARRLLAETTRRSGVDYAVRLATDGLGGAGFVPVPGQGPLLVCRPLASTEPPAAAVWRLTLGDIEMF